MSGAQRIVGLVFAVLLALALYYAWRSVPDVLQLAPAPARGLLFALRLPLEILGAFLILSGAERLWQAVVTRWFV